MSFRASKGGFDLDLELFCPESRVSLSHELKSNLSNYSLSKGMSFAEIIKK